MIIGNNGFNGNGNGFQGNNFENKFKRYNENGETHQGRNIFVKDIKEQVHANVNSKDEMSDKTLAMLHERLAQGLITLDEFNKQCEKLGKKRNN